jgi:hypothetical protein
VPEHRLRYSNPGTPNLNVTDLKSISYAAEYVSENLTDRFGVQIKVNAGLSIVIAFFEDESVRKVL